MKLPFEQILAVGLLSSLLVLADGAPSRVADIGDLASARGTLPAPATNAVDIAANEARLVEAWGRGVPDGAVPLEDTSFPVAHYPNGNVRAQLKADHAFLPPDEDDFVRGHGVIVEMFSELGRFEGMFQADNCIYDRSTRSGYSEGNVLILYRNVEITGSNMMWHVVNRNARILSRSKVVLNRFSEGMKGAFSR